VNVRWFGHSAFLLSGERRVAIDPFWQMAEVAAARGLKFDYPEIHGLEADLLLVTHEHRDHNGVEAVAGSPVTIRSTAGTFASVIGEVVAVASEHDRAAGTERGPNTIFRFTLDGLRVCHLGDFGQPALRPEQLEAIGAVDLLFVPVGDGVTLGGEGAAAVVRALRPRLAVPMHYRTEALDFLEPADAFLAALGAPVEQLETSDFEVEPLLGTHDAVRVAVPRTPRR